MENGLLISAYMVQAFLVAYVGVKIVGEEVGTKKLLLIAILLGFTIYFVRSLYEFFDLPFGIHSIILFFLIIIFFKVIVPLTWMKSFGGAMISFSLAALGGIIPFGISEFLGLTLELVIDSKLILAPFTLLESALLIVTAIILKVKNYQIYD